MSDSGPSWREAVGWARYRRGMSIGRRALREIEETERKLDRIVRSIRAGNADLEEVRVTLERLLRGELQEAERLVYRIRDAD